MGAREWGIGAVSAAVGLLSGLLLDNLWSTRSGVQPVGDSRPAVGSAMSADVRPQQLPSAQPDRLAGLEARLLEIETSLGRLVRTLEEAPKSRPTPTDDPATGEDDWRGKIEPITRRLERLVPQSSRVAEKQRRMFLEAQGSRDVEAETLAMMERQTLYLEETARKVSDALSTLKRVSTLDDWSRWRKEYDWNIEHLENLYRGRSD